MSQSDPGPTPDRTFRRAIRATRTRAFATTAVDPKTFERDEDRPRGIVGGGDLPEIGDVVGAHYKVVSVLGEGNMGKVYVAERLDVPEHRVALKILPRSLYAGRNVEKELVMLATVGHPHMVQMKDHGVTESYVWLTMPVYEGETLGERLERGPLSLRDAYDIFLPIARAIEALHQAGLRHQDIKPDNIFLATFAGRLHPVLLDLGVAAEKDSTFIAGTALFAAPEQLLAIIGVPGAIPLSEKMDTYTFATTLLFALVGEAKFPGAKARTRDDIVESHENRATDPLRGCLPRLEGKPRELLQEQLKRWLALDPLERPTIAEVAEGLEVLLEPEREAEREEVRLKEAQKRTLARTRLGALIALVVAGALGGAGLYKRQTLALAGELERARKDGAQSFTKLDSCTASFTVEHQDRLNCEQDRAHERKENEDTIAALSNKNDGCASITTELTNVRNRLTQDVDNCREGLKTQKTKSDAAITKLTDDFATEKTKLTGDKDKCEKDLATADEEAKNFKAEKDACDATRQSCIEERDACEKINPKGSGGTAAAVSTGPGAGAGTANGGSQGPATGVDAGGAPQPQPQPTAQPQPQPQPTQPTNAPAPPKPAEDPYN